MIKYILDQCCFAGLGLRFFNNNQASSQRQVNKTITMEWLSVDKTLFCLRGSAEECQQNAKAEYYITSLCCGACRARRDVKIKLHPPALHSPFCLWGRTAACIVSVWWLAEGERHLKTLCRVHGQTLIAPNTHKSMVVKHTANSYGCYTVSKSI